MRRLLTVSIMIPALAGAGCGGNSGADASSAANSVASSVASSIPEAYTVDLAEQNGSGESGTAAFTPVGSDQLKVVLDITGGGDTAQPAHIHTGTCDALGDIAYPLSDVVNGHSETTIDLSLADLQAKAATGLAVNVHESAEKINNYVACGDITPGM
jgi:hypothetical protein